MVARSDVPAKPELAKQGNGMRVIRYPATTKKGGAMTRNYKLGWVDDTEAQRQLDIFSHHWGKMNGKGPEGVIAKMKAKDKPAKGKALLSPEDAKKEKARKYQRDWYKRMKDGSNAAPDKVLSKVQDIVAILASSMQATSTGLKMLQELVTELQKR